ncbi:hypothetical protein K438DRAFT_1763264 [Mycena galopus ATCC 62051]|nr:hypothetical protein K438DRAFT_1763264 [Mycena galopus ATCC 62051]
MQILPAKEEYLGIWIHGITEEDLKFFLSYARVPCFLIHELIVQEAPGKLVMEDFVQAQQRVVHTTRCVATPSQSVLLTHSRTPAFGKPGPMGPTCSRRKNLIGVSSGGVHTRVRQG